jgi:hypothetical protein
MHRQNPAVPNQVSFPRNNLSWTREEKRTSIHKVVPGVQVIFPWGVLYKGEVLGHQIITPPWLSGTFGDVRLGSGHSVSRSSGRVVQTETKDESVATRHAV